MMDSETPNEDSPTGPRWKLARQAEWWVIILVVCTVGGLASAFPWSLLSAPAESLAAATRGLVQPVLVASVVYVALPIVVVMLVIGRLRPADIGLHANDLVPAASFAMLVWLATQMGIALLHWTLGKELSIAEPWNHRATANLGQLVGQLCGSALYEEIIFRGFFMAQCFALLRNTPVSSEKVKVLLAVLSSTGLFALYHVPYRMHDGVPVTGGMVFGWTFLGICFCLTWIVTDNLLLAIAIHALLNRPTPLLSTPESPQEIVFLLSFLGVAIIGVARRKKAHHLT